MGFDQHIPPYYPVQALYDFQGGRGQVVYVTLVDPMPQ
jgi:hypothetical protein